MFIPLHDDTPLKVIRFQYVTVLIIAANVAIFLMTTAFHPEAFTVAVASAYGVVPAELTGHSPQFSAWPTMPEPATLVTYLFLHGGWMHVLSNMLFLWVFADNVEDAFGYAAFAIFYLLCGIAGGLTHVFIAPASQVPLIGASGAVSGVLAAYLLLYPKARVWILLFLRLPLRIGATWVLGGWFVLQVVSLFIETGEDVQVAWWAHIGGFVAGLILTLLLRSRLLIRVGG